MRSRQLSVICWRKYILCIPNAITVLRYSTTTTVVTTKDDATLSVLCRACVLYLHSAERQFTTHTATITHGSLGIGCYYSGVKAIIKINTCQNGIYLRTKSESRNEWHTLMNPCHQWKYYHSFWLTWLKWAYRIEYVTKRKQSGSQVLCNKINRYVKDVIAD